MAPPESTLATFDAFMKELYSGTVPQDVAMRDHPFFGMVPKRGGFVGDVMPVPVLYGHPMGRSHTFASAQGNATESESIKFLMTRTRNYGIVTIDAELMQASKNDLGAFAEARKVEIDSMLEEMGNSAGFGLFNNGVGNRAQVINIATDTLTLDDPTKTRFFSVGMTIRAVSNDTSGGTLRTGTFPTVIAVDRQAGTIELNAGGVAAHTGFVVNDFIHQEGDFNAEISGLRGWLPLTAPSGGDNWFGVDRSVDVDRLAGVRLNTPANPIHENLTTLAELIKANNGNVSHAFINHTKYTELAFELGSKVEYATGGQGNVNFTGIRIYTSAGSFMVYPDPDCPVDRGYCLTMSTWVLRHLNEFPHIVDDDGKTSLRITDADGIEIRARAWGNLVCNAPARNGVCAL